jgi:cytochrome c-type biogenesis protein CcmH
MALRCVLLALLAPLLLAGSWTEDRGEQGSDEDRLALGADVESKVGPPAGPELSGPALEARTSDLSSEMRCPVCQGLSINDSPAESARNMKRQVRAMIAAGYDDTQIKEYFVGAYGEFVLMSPKPEGFNLLVWILPGAVVLLGLVVIGLMVTKRRDDTPAADPDDDAPSELDPWLARVREELANDDG